MENMLENRSQLKETKIRGYKSLGTNTQPIELKLNDLNIIIGANGAGKSNFISFFQMLSNMMTGALQVYIGKMNQQSLCCSLVLKGRR